MWLLIDPDRFDNHICGKMIIKLGAFRMINQSPVHYHDGKFPPRDLLWGELMPHIGQAAAALGRYDGILAAVPNPELLLAPLTTQEAVMSARIEGTQATISEVYQFGAGQPRGDARTPRGHRRNHQLPKSHASCGGDAQ